jgi:hypothetical protein
VAQARRVQIRRALARTLEKKRIEPLSLTFAWTLYREGTEGLLRRANLLAHLLSNTQHLGLVVHGDYLHLSRSIAALLGTLVNLYKDVPRRWVVADLVIAFNSFPALALQDALRETKADIAEVVGARAESAPRRMNAAAAGVATS